MKKLIVCAAALCMSSTLFAHSQHAHVHGLVEMDVAVEAGQVTVFIQSPLDNFLGFEHAARTPQQIQRAQTVWAQLQKAHDLVVPDKAASCQAGDVSVESDILENAHKAKNAQNPPKGRLVQKPFSAEVGLSNRIEH